METPLLKAGGQQQENVIFTSNYGSTPKSQAINSDGNGPKLSARIDVDVGSGDDADLDTSDGSDVSAPNLPGVRPEDAQVPVDGVDEGNSSEISPPASAAPDPAIVIPENSASTDHYRHNNKNKNIALGLLDVALLFANASQLKTVLDRGNSNPYFFLLVVLICLSITLQIVAVVLTFYVAKLDIKDNEGERKKCSIMNNAVGILGSIVLAINAMLLVFGLLPDGNLP